MWSFLWEKYVLSPLWAVTKDHKTLKMNSSLHSQQGFLSYLETQLALGRSIPGLNGTFQVSKYNARVNILNECKDSLSPFCETFVDPSHYGKESYQIWVWRDKGNVSCFSRQYFLV